MDPIHQLVASTVAECSLHNLVDPEIIAGALAAARIRLQRMVHASHRNKAQNAGVPMAQRRARWRLPSARPIGWRTFGLRRPLQPPGRRPRLLRARRRLGKGLRQILKSASACVQQPQPLLPTLERATPTSCARLAEATLSRDGGAGSVRRRWRLGQHDDCSPGHCGVPHYGERHGSLFAPLRWVRGVLSLWAVGLGAAGIYVCCAVLCWGGWWVLERSRPRMLLRRRLCCWGVRGSDDFARNLHFSLFKRIDRP